MQLSDIFLRLGEENFERMLRSVALGKLRTYQLFDAFKTRLHVQKLNTETLKKIGPRTWARLQEEGSADLATELAQAILISHMDMIQAVLNDLGIPHQDGFFEKDADLSKFLADGWQQRAWSKFLASYPPAALLFYLNHLGWEVGKADDVFLPAA